MNTPTLINVCHTVAQTGLTLFCQSSLLLLLGLLLSASLHRRGPLVQSLICRATLIAVVLTAFFSICFTPATRPIWHVSLPDISETAASTPPVSQPVGAETLRVALPRPQSPAKLPSGAMALQTTPVNAAPPPATTPQPLSAADQVYIAIVTIWAVGAAGLLSWLLIGQFCLLRLRRRGVLVTTGSAADILHSLCAERAWRPLPLIASPHIHSPFLAGVWHPTIFIPTSYLTDFDTPALQAIFTHEMVHRGSGDNTWMLLARLTGALLWMQPLLWRLIRRLEQTSEEVCDALVLNAGCSPRAYADCLLTLAERLTPSRLERSLGAGIVPFRSLVGRRIQQILAAPHLLPTPSARHRTLAIVGTALIVMLGSRLISSADPSGNAADVAGAYLRARSLGQFPTAYGLLSPQTQRYITLSDFAKRRTVSYGSGFHPPDSYAAQDALFELFAYGSTTQGFRYELIGPVPDDPAVALIRAYPPGDTTHAGLTLRILTTADPADSSRRRLDMVATLKPLIPDVAEKLQARRDAIACTSYLKQIGFAVLEYVVNHHEHFPHAAHWVDEIRPYVKDVSIFHDPAAPVSQKYSYAFNRNLSGVSLTGLDYPAQTIAVFDSAKGVKNASDTGQSLPYPGRHTDGNEFAFADGHVKYLREWKGTATFSPSGGLPAQAAMTPVRLMDGPDRVPKADAVILTGRVVYPNGKPAPGVLLIAQHSGPVSSTSHDRHAVEEADGTTGPDGTYRLAGLSDDHYNVAVREATGQWVAKAARDVIGSKGSTVHIPNLVLTHGAWITGRVTDAKTGQPLEGIQVGCYGPADPTTSAMVAVSAPTNRDGVYWVRVAPGRNIAYIYNSQAKTGPYKGAGELGRSVAALSGKATVVPFRLMELNAAALRVSRVTLLSERAALREQLVYAERQLAVSRQQIDSHPMPPRVPAAPAIVPAGNAKSPQTVKWDYVQAVHEHNQQTVKYWNAIAVRSSWQAKVQRVQTALDGVDEQIRHLNAAQQPY